MVPSSITIKLDFGSGAQVDSNSASRDGGVPTPYSSGALAALSVSAQGQSTEALPTPSLSLGPAGSMGWANDVSLQGDVPTPLTAGGFSAASTGAAAHATPPTPMDNPAHSAVFDGGQAPEPSRDNDDVGEKK